MDEVEEELQDWEMLETTSIYSSPPTIIQVGDAQSVIQSDYFNIHRVPSAESVTTEDNNEMGGGDGSKHELGSEERDHGPVLEGVRGFGEVGSEVCSEPSEIQDVEEDKSADAQEMENSDAETVTGGYEQTRDSEGVEDRSGDVIQGGDEARSVTVWWKVPVELLKLCAFRVSPVWTFSIAAAVMGLILLKRRLSRMSRKSRSIPIKLTVRAGSGGASLLTVEDKVSSLCSLVFIFLSGCVCITF